MGPWSGVVFGLGLACQTKAIAVIQKLNSCQNHRIKRVKLRSIARHCATKKADKITMHLGLENIIKLKFTTNFDRCATLIVLNCLTKHFEP